VDDRLERLESSISELQKSVRDLEARLRLLELGSPGESNAAATASSAQNARVAIRELPDSSRLIGSAPVPVPAVSFDLFGPVLPLAGRSVLVLGGAFLVRVLTEAGTLPPRAGVALGLLYALSWLALADRSAARGKPLSGVFLGVSSLLIACPLVWEATTRFHAVSPPVAITILAGLVILAFTVAVRRRLRLVAWAATLLPIATALGLFTVPGAAVPLCLFLIGLTIGTSALADSKTFAGQRWAAAVVADLTVFLVIELVSRPGGLPEAYGTLSRFAVIALALLLPASFLAAIALRALVLRRAPDIFEGFQSAAAIAVGLAGALRLAHGLPLEAPIALTGVMLGAAAYLTALLIVERAPEQRSQFLYFSSLAPLLILLSTGPTLPGPPAALLRNALAIFTATAAVRFRRKVLGLHSAVFLAAATAVSGFFQTSLACFLAPQLPPAIPGHVLREATAAGIVYAILAFGSRGEAEKWSVRLTAAFTAGLTLLGFGALLLVLVGRVPAISRDPGALAAARTAVLSASAVGVAFAGRRWSVVELSWIAWAVLAAGAAKILMQDLPSGRASTLFLSFLFYGAALIFAARFLSRRPSSGSTASPPQTA
jgi:hypothetical protein